jgi:hypothetical protein
VSGAPRAARLWLGAGALLGVLLAVKGVVHRGPGGALPPGVVALVGEAPITEAEFARAVAAVESDRRDHQADPALRAHVLDRLIEEQLLVDGAFALGLPTRDARLRGQVASAMLEALVGDSLAAPGEVALRAFHASHAASFTRRGRQAVEVLFFRGDGGQQRAEAARARLAAGEPLGVLRPDADALAVPVPASPLPAAKLADYLPPAAVRGVSALPVGGVLVLPVEGAVYLVRLAERQDGEQAQYEEMKDEVLAEWRHDADDQRLRRWLDQRRSATRVVVREVAP